MNGLRSVLRIFAKRHGLYFRRNFDFFLSDGEKFAFVLNFTIYVRQPKATCVYKTRGEKKNTHGLCKLWFNVILGK